MGAFNTDILNTNTINATSAITTTLSASSLQTTTLQIYNTGSTIATHFRQVRCSFGDWFTAIPSDYNSQSLLAFNTWYMLTFVRNNNTLYTYANGVQYGSATTTTASTIPISGTCYIGRGPGGGAFFSGQTDEFGVWDRALTQSEITQLYNTSGGTQYPFFTGRTLDISGTNAAPTGAGLTAKTSLQGKGFTVTTN